MEQKNESIAWAKNHVMFSSLPKQFDMPLFLIADLAKQETFPVLGFHNRTGEWRTVWPGSFGEFQETNCDGGFEFCLMEPGEPNIIQGRTTLDKLVVQKRIVEEVFGNADADTKKKSEKLFEHSDDFSIARFEGQNFNFSYNESVIIGRLIENYRNGNDYVKNGVLVQGLEGYQDVVKRVFKANKRSHVFCDEIGFIEAKHGRFRLSISKAKPLKKIG